MVNTIEDIKKFIQNPSFEKIFILCGKKSFTTSGAKQFFIKELEKKKVNLYFKNSEIPTLNELIEIIREIKNFEPNLILAVGGGTVIDYAKIANVVEERSDLADLIITYSYPFKKKRSCLAVIPTTAGSGAEVTSNAVIYVDGVKHSFESNLLIPDNFFLIPDFLISAPNKIKASAGFDAIAQAIESIISKKSNDESINFAKKSLEISTNHFFSFLKNPNQDNASKMIIASNLAGKAINISKTTAPHAVSYPFTSLFNISHGHAVSLFFENFLKFNYDNISSVSNSFNLNKRFDLIFKIFNVNNILDFSNKISQLKKEALLNDNLDYLKIDLKKDTHKIMNGINLLRLKNNPVQLTKENIYNIISKKK